MARSFLQLLVVFIFATCFSTGFCSAAEIDSGVSDFISLEQQYKQAKFYYNELHSNNTLGNSRTNWLKGVQTFRKIYLAGPKSNFAAPSLYMLGRMYSKMYDRFHDEIDLKESLSYYRDVTDLFPENRLADDALYAVGNLQLTKRDNPQKAATSYTRIISDFKNGDMYTHAADKLKKISKEHDIPIPDAMLKRTYLENLTNVLPVKYWSSNNYTRVVINTSGPVRYQERLLEKNGDKPRRLYLDFQESYIDPKLRSPVPIEDGLLQQVRTGQFTPDIVRVVLDIESIADYKIFSLPDPFRVVIDVRGEPKVSSKIPEKALPKPPANVTTPTQNTKPTASGTITTVTSPINSMSSTVIILEDFKKVRSNLRQSKDNEIDLAGIDSVEKHITKNALSLAQQLGLGIRKIVIDPGHGGKDPGASSFGMKEKDIVLKIAQNLAPILADKTNAEVILTRDTDIYIPLEERTAIANTNDADLFISLHINAHPSPKIHGLETYYLNLSTNAEAMRVAAFENATSTHQMSDLQDILSDIMKNSKIKESSRLAGFVHNSLSDGIEGIQKNKFRNLGVKQAPFYVLIGAEMPAILIEIGFITNQMDLENLKSDLFLDMIVDEIVQGVQNYINSTTASL